MAPKNKIVYFCGNILARVEIILGWLPYRIS